MRMSDWSSDVCSSDLLHQSEAMPSTLEEMAFARRAARAGRRTQANAVLDLDDIIVLSVEQEQRRLVGADMAFGRIERLARRVGSSPEQLFAASGMGNGRVHRHQRIEAGERIGSRREDAGAIEIGRAHV